MDRTANIQSMTNFMRLTIDEVYFPIAAHGDEVISIQDYLVYGVVVDL